MANSNLENFELRVVFSQRVQYVMAFKFNLE